MTAVRPSAAASVVTASACAFAMIATQVAGKATRDALFLTHFDISALPVVLVVSALLSIGAVLLTARAMSLFGPSRVIPPFFVASGVLLLAEWLIGTRNAPLASVAVYLHVAVIGSILISGFWSIINERFDPRTGKKNIGRIVATATAGGLFGGLLAERVGAWAGILWVLPIVAGFHFACAWLLRALQPDEGDTPAPPLQSLFTRSGQEQAGESGFGVVRRVPYLRNLALIVLLGNVAATLVDFLFKAKAQQSYTGSADLVRFFAVFYTAVSLATLAVQAGVTRRIIEKIGIANAMVVRPAVMTTGGLIAVPFMGLAGLGILRGLEAVLQGSVFRSAYELLFTPVAAQDKRKTKAIIDVGVDRMGDTIGGALIRVVILLPAALAGHVLLGLAVVMSLAGFVVARALHRGYVRALEASLINRANVLDIQQDEAPGMRTMMMESFTGIDLSASLNDLKLDDVHTATLPAATAPPGTDEALIARGAPAPVHPTTVADPEVAALIELRSGELNRVRAQLRNAHSLSPIIAAQVITLLAWDDVTVWAWRALAKAAPSISGQLIDRVLDPNEDFAIRRRIPRILAACATPRARDGLMVALTDKRFEVRFHTGRALAAMHEHHPSLAIDNDAVYAAVLRETRVEKALWEEQRLIDEPDNTASAVDPELKGSRRLEHVFTILSLVLPRAPLQIAFKGLLTDDAVLRGTSIEYVESVLPREVWESLSPFLEDTRTTGAQHRSSGEVLDELLRSSQSIDLNLAEIKKRAGGA